MARYENLSVGDLATRKIRPENGVQADHIGDISDAATGAQIATAVNALIKVLEDIGATKNS